MRRSARKGSPLLSAFLTVLFVVNSGPWSIVAAGRIWTGASTEGPAAPTYGSYVDLSPQPQTCSAVLPLQCASLPTGIEAANTRVQELERLVSTLTSRIEDLELRFPSRSHSPPSPPPSSDSGYPPLAPWSPLLPALPARPPSSPYSPSPLPFPPAPLSGYNTVLEHQMYGNGLYRVSASSDLGYPEAAWQAFDYQINTGGGNMWTIATHTLYDNYPPHSYLGQTTTRIGDSSYAGEWLQIQMPQRIKVHQYALWTREGGFLDRGPNDFKLLGSVDGVNWAIVDERADITNWNTAGFMFTVADSAQYDHFRLCVGSNNGGGWLTLYEMTLYAFWNAPEPTGGDAPPPIFGGDAPPPLSDGGSDALPPPGSEGHQWTWPTRYGHGQNVLPPGATDDWDQAHARDGPPPLGGEIGRH